MALSGENDGLDWGHGRTIIKRPGQRMQLVDYSWWGLTWEALWPSGLCGVFFHCTLNEQSWLLGLIKPEGLNLWKQIKSTLGKSASLIVPGIARVSLHSSSGKLTIGMDSDCVSPLT